MLKDSHFKKLHWYTKEYMMILKDTIVILKDTILYQRTQSGTNEHSQYIKGHCQFTRMVSQYAKGLSF